MRFLKLWLQIALEWVHECCMLRVVGRKSAIFTEVIFFLKILLKSASIFFFLASRSGFGGAISDTVARSSIVFCNSVSADRIVVAASRLLGAAAACVILLSFAAEDRQSYWSGCIQAAIVICQQIFAILALLKSASKSSFCRFGVEIRFWSCNFRRRCA